MPHESRTPGILRFGTFEVDVRAGELRKQGVRIKLQEQPFHVLTVLLQRPGEVVTREELRSQNWPADTFVDFDNSLNTAINKLREALGDSADNPRFIETLPRRGYRFLAPVSGDTPKKPEITRNGRKIALLGAAATLFAVAAVGAAGYGVYALLYRSRTVPFQSVSMSRVTETGKASLAAISPDGRYILHVTSDSGMESLWIRHVPTDSNTQVALPAKLHYIGLRFSPDGNYIYFVRCPPPGTRCYLYRCPVLGGSAQQIVDNIDSNVTFSPDGKKLAFIRYNDPPGKCRFLVHSLELGTEQTLASGPVGEKPNDPAWSPDGKFLVYPVFQPGDAESGLMALDVASGKQRMFFISRDIQVRRSVWLPDGSGLLVAYSSSATSYRLSQLGFISYPEAKFYDVTRDANSYSDLGVAADGKTVATVQRQGHWDLFVTPVSHTSGGPLLPLTSGASVQNLTWTQDGNVIFVQANRIYRTTPDGGPATEFLAYAEPFLPLWPSACLDGHFVVFSAVFGSRSSSQNVWRTDASGGNMKQITSGKLDQVPLCSPDGHWVLYSDQEKGGALMKVPIEGGTSQRIAESVRIAPGGRPFDVSRDGRFVALISVDWKKSPAVEKLALVALDSGKTVKLLDFRSGYQPLPRFAPDGKALVYLVRENGTDNLWLQPLDGSPGKQITDFKAEGIRDFHWSPDGRKVGLVRGHTDSDVVLIRDSGSSRK